MLKNFFNPFDPTPRPVSSPLLSNYVQLFPGVPCRMHFTDDYLIERTIQDKETGKPKTIKSLVFYCNEVDGEPSSRSFSILSQKLAGHFEPFLPGKRYLDYDFIITQMGDGFLKDWNVQMIQRPKTE